MPKDTPLGSGEIPGADHGDTQGPAGAKPGDARHEQARALAEKALDHYAHDDPKTGDELAEEAATLDRSAVEEVVAELDEDAPNHAKD